MVRDNSPWCLKINELRKHITCVTAEAITGRLASKIRGNKVENYDLKIKTRAEDFNEL